MALKESNKNRKKPVTQKYEEPAIHTDTTIWTVLIICLVIAFFAAM
jgi:hypothetical protein